MGYENKSEFRDQVLPKLSSFKDGGIYAFPPQDLAPADPVTELMNSASEYFVQCAIIQLHADTQQKAYACKRLIESKVSRYYL